ncbi:Zinc finger protein CONSTANS-LIKE 5 [Acorus gramineus]|uniref:Zinc finger protein CONSTANS-LIKE 5 n=1 Tax=Acorus gramineus TaxID=55184 RepID=A0AAV9BFQ3_ACOGR|nr:Zinc finger protein CONSTANS-LIKE 5 [Acorus gramineus]
MYAEERMYCAYISSFSHDMQDYCRISESNARNTLMQSSTVSDYDLGGEGDLFKAPEPIIEELLLSLDPMSAAFSLISNGEDLTSGETIKVADIGSMQNGPLLSEVFYECKKDLLAQSSAIEEESLGEVPDVKLPVVTVKDDLLEDLLEKCMVEEVTQEIEVPCVRVGEDRSAVKDGLFLDGAIQKSVSAGCLSSMDWLNGSGGRPSFLDFQGVDLGASLGLRRAHSENDIQTLGIGNANFVQPSFDHHRFLSIGSYAIEERKQKLSRYRKKKSKRNFGRKIKYACRKALADSQPRVRGRFAKTEESEVPKLLM